MSAVLQSWGEGEWEGWVGGCGKVGEWVGSGVDGRVWVWEGGQVLYVHEFAVNCLSPSLVSVHTGPKWRGIVLSSRRSCPI